MDMTGAFTTELTGAEMVSRCLADEGVEFVFGYPGGAVLPIYDELFKQDKVKHKAGPRAPVIVNDGR